MTIRILAVPLLSTSKEILNNTEQIAAQIRDSGFQVDIDYTTMSTWKRTHKIRFEQYRYILLVGSAKGIASIRTAEKDLGSLTIARLLEILKGQN